MKKFIINDSNIRKLDSHLNLTDPDIIDAEVEKFIENFWNNTGKHEELFRPFFTTSLQYNFLRPLYIYYYSLKNLKQIHKEIEIVTSTCIIDIVAKHLDIKLNKNRKFIDRYLFHKRIYEFNNDLNFYQFFKKFIKYLYSLIKNKFRIKVIYLDGGKLSKDFEEIPNSISGFQIPMFKSNSFNPDINKIQKQIIKNINNSEVSIPKELIIELVKINLFNIFPKIINKISIYFDYINKKNIKLVVVSAPTHEDHLSLVAASKLAGCKSLVMWHGFTFQTNPFLNYCDFQGITNEFDPKYKEAVHYPLIQSWFDEKLEI